MPDSVNTYNTPTYANMKDRESALFISDRWRPARKLTVNLGLRVENNYGWQTAACQEATLFFKAQCYAPLKGFPDWNAVDPRFSVVYDLAGDGKTALKFASHIASSPRARRWIWTLAGTARSIRSKSM